LAVATETDVTVLPAQSRWVAVRLQVQYGTVEPGSHPIRFAVQALNHDARVVEKSVFLVPR
jgi:IG-like fold at C-terminal of FixG, putative oxidoreductase